MGARGLDQRVPLALDPRHELEPIVLLHDESQQLPPILERQTRRVPAVQPQEVEHDERHRDLRAYPLDLTGVRQVHPLLERLERVPPARVEGHDLAVDHRVHLVDELVDHVELRVLRGHVATGP